MHKSIYVRSEHYTGSKTETKQIRPSNEQEMKVKCKVDSYALKHGDASWNMRIDRATEQRLLRASKRA